MQDEPVEDEQVDGEHSFHRTNFILRDPRYGKVYKALYKTPQLQNLLLELNRVIRNIGFVLLSGTSRVEDFHWRIPTDT